MQVSERCSVACDILRLTNDGDNLDLLDLKVVENAVNGFLNEEGYAYFMDLHKRVLSGKYLIPWFHEIEYLTIDHEGYVYWKGQHVEHYSRPWAYSSEAKAQAEELARRCKILEEQGQEISVATAIWGWED